MQAPIGFVPLAQTDPRWAQELLGNSATATIGKYGCALCAVTNLHNWLTGAHVDLSGANKALRAKGAFIDALMWWVKVPLVFPELKFIYRDFNYNNALVASYVYLRRIPVIVQVRTAFTPSHFVLYIGDQMMIDSQDGRIKPTKTYPTTLGDVRYQRS